MKTGCLIAVNVFSVEPDSFDCLETPQAKLWLVVPTTQDIPQDPVGLISLDTTDSYAKYCSGRYSQTLGRSTPIVCPR